MNGWKSSFSPDTPCWTDFSDLIARLRDDRFPGACDLNGLMPEGACNEAGHPVQFVPADALPGVAYEEHIHATGQVSTRAENWHDLFNAIIWAGYPRLKSAMNAMHHTAMPGSTPQGRGRLRDALTLFDECGVVFASSDRDLLEALAIRHWGKIFSHAEAAQSVFIIGHAMLEKLLQPYKSMTANALLVEIPSELQALPRARIRSALDTMLASELLAGSLFESSKDLSPLPLMGLSGWWPGGAQDRRFYDDPDVFRQPPEGFSPAPVFSIAGQA